MISESFAEGDSVMHRLNPKVKIVFAVLFSVVVAVSGNLATLATALLAAVLMVLAARLNGAAVLKRLTVLLGFILLIWAVMPFTYEGPPLFCVGSLCLTRPGVILSAQISLKSLAILTAFLALIATMTIPTLGHALSSLGLPDKLVYLFLITYRYIFVLEQEYQRLLRAMKIRGFRPGTNLHTYQSYAYLIGMLFVRSSIRGERVYKAMKCRGFSGKFHTLLTFRSDKSNWMFSFIMTAVIALLMGCELWNKMK